MAKLLPVTNWTSKLIKTYFMEERPLCKDLSTQEKVIFQCENTSQSKIDNGKEKAKNENNIWNFIMTPKKQI